MSFADPSTHEHRLRLGCKGYGTIEVGHGSTRKGIVVELGVTSRDMLMHVMCEAFELAGAQKTLRVSDPGWWAALIGAAGLRATGYASIQRVTVPGQVHAVVVVEPSRMLESHPVWPLTRYGPTGRWHDHRGEAAYRHGPADVELAAYASEHGIDRPVHELRAMFDQGVLEWKSSCWNGAGRRPIVPAGRS